LKNIETLRQNHLRETGETGEFVFGITKFSDLSVEEFKGRYLNFRPSPKVFAAHQNTPIRKTTSPAADSVDWRNTGAITPVKDQGQCGSCWAFSTTEEVESMWYLSKKSLPVLSPQQIVSCDKVDQGCNGGDTVSAYTYVKANGLETEEAYPYKSGETGSNGACKYNSGDVVAKITGFEYATPPCTGACNTQNETKLAESLTGAPISICVYAESWQFYSSGILKSNCPKAYDQLDHCVQLVGYDNTQTTPYWIVRNSWAADWGIDGFIYIEKGNNLCGVADEATIVTVD